MATPRYPSTLPGISSLQLSPTAQVLTPEEGAGHMTARRISRVPHATATVVFRFLESDFQVFQAFYVNDLKRGHKWFALDLPSAAGVLPHAVRCIKHRTAPSQGFNHREVTMQLEIRGRRIYDDDLEGPPPPDDGPSGWNTTNPTPDGTNEWNIAWTFTNDDRTGTVSSGDPQSGQGT